MPWSNVGMLILSEPSVLKTLRMTRVGPVVPTSVDQISMS